MAALESQASTTKKIESARRNHVRSAVYSAVFIAASAILAYVKIPAPIGSIALDAVPGYFSGAYLGIGYGALVGALGHIASAAIAGFPLGFVHLWIALIMTVCCIAFGGIIRSIDRTWALIPATVVAVLLNGVLAPLALSWLGLLPIPANAAVIGPLAAASALNAGAASFAVWVLARRDIPGL